MGLNALNQISDPVQKCVGAIQGLGVVDLDLLQKLVRLQDEWARSRNVSRGPGAALVGDFASLGALFHSDGLTGQPGDLGARGCYLIRDRQVQTVRQIRKYASTL